MNQLRYIIIKLKCLEDINKSEFINVKVKYMEDINQSQSVIQTIEID